MITQRPLWPLLGFLSVNLVTRFCRVLLATVMLHKDVTVWAIVIRADGHDW